LLIFFLPPRPLRFGYKRDERYERGFYFHTYDSGILLDHILNQLSPRPAEVRIHPNQGASDPSKPWGALQNVIYEIVRPG